MGYKISNDANISGILDDPSISWKAKGIFLYMLTSDNGVTQNELKAASTDGSSSVQSAIRQLTEAGYIYLARQHDEKGHILPSNKTVERQGWVYVIQRYDGLCKIGQTNDLTRRLSILSFQYGFVPRIVIIETSDLNSLEGFLHDQFASKRKEGEWFRITKDDIEWLQETNWDESGWRRKL